MNLLHKLQTENELGAKFLASAELHELCELFSNDRIEHSREYRLCAAFLDYLPDSISAEDPDDSRTRLAARILATIAQREGEKARANYYSSLPSHWARVVAGDDIATAIIRAVFTFPIRELMAQNSSWCGFSWDPVQTELARMRHELTRRGEDSRRSNSWRAFCCFAYNVEWVFNGLINATGCAVFPTDESSGEQQYLEAHRAPRIQALAERRRARVDERMRQWHIAHSSPANVALRERAYADSLARLNAQGAG